MPTSGLREMGSEIRLFTIALHLADSYINDASFTTKSWSEASSIPAHEITTMQREALTFLNWNINVSKEEFELWVEEVMYFSGNLKKSIESKKLDMNTQQMQLILSLWPSSNTPCTIPYPSPPVSPQSQQLSLYHPDFFKRSQEYVHLTKQKSKFNYSSVNQSAIRKLPIIRPRNEQVRVVNHFKFSAPSDLVSKA
ncbi:hypothetical protein HK096_011643, partial [Nowakowskiella sp. JEL0078]